MILCVMDVIKEVSVLIGLIWIIIILLIMIRSLTEDFRVEKEKIDK